MSIEPHVAPAASLKAAQVLTKAVLRAGQLLALSDQELGRILGVSPATVSRLSRGRTIAPQSKEGELARLFVRIYRSLDALVGGRQEASRAWLRAHNHHL